MSQYLQQNDEIKLSNLINQIGKKFLSSIPTSQQTSQTTTHSNETNPTEQTSPTDTPGQMALSDEIVEQLLPKAHQSAIHNEELKALERFLARDRTAHTILTGNEEPPIVYTFINATPARQSYKEGKSIKNRCEIRFFNSCFIASSKIS
jgi:GTPase Era involved in 16S rRNA processing